MGVDGFLDEFYDRFLFVYVSIFVGLEVWCFFGVVNFFVLDSFFFVLLWGLFSSFFNLRFYILGLFEIDFGYGVGGWKMFLDILVWLFFLFLYL